MSDGVTVRLLGPVEAGREGAWLRPGTPQQRLVLGLLALRAGFVVPTGELIDAVWDDAPPRSARNSIQVLLANLRKTLPGNLGAALVRRGDGYQFEAGPDGVDVQRFRCLVGKARRAGAGPAAVAGFDQALALWRGPALADAAATERASLIRSGLDGERLAAVQDRLGTLLACGRHADAATELESLLAEHPLSEGQAGMLMLALYRCGRQADALEVFRGLRARLVGDLGIEPGPELQRLQQRILAHDPDLAARPATAGVAAISGPGGEGAAPGGPGTAPEGPGTAPGGPGTAPGSPGTAHYGPGTVPGSPGTAHCGPGGVLGGQAPAGSAGQGPGQRAGLPWPVIPRQLPAAAPHLVGRSGELESLTALLNRAGENASAVPISVIGGAAGVGKTALALQWAHQAAGRFPDGQLYVNLRGVGSSRPPATPAEVLGGFLGALQAPAGWSRCSLDAQAALYRSLLSGRRMLVVLDNARDAGQVRPLLPGSPGCMALVTSRSRLTGLVAEGAHTLSLDVLSDEESRLLLARRLGPARLAAEPAAASEVARLCAQLPLALSIAAARLATRPWLSLATLAAQLRDTQGRLSALAAGDPAGLLRVYAGSQPDGWDTGERLPAEHRPAYEQPLTAEAAAHRRPGRAHARPSRCCLRYGRPGQAAV